MMVAPEAGNPTESPPLRHRRPSIGRLPVEAYVDPAVDLARSDVASFRELAGAGHEAAIQIVPVKSHVCAGTRVFSR
jgi:hypothetical protein